MNTIYEYEEESIHELRVFRAGPEHPPPSIVRIGTSELHPSPVELKAPT